jgi:hypothetical protein
MKLLIAPEIVTEIESYRNLQANQITKIVCHFLQSNKNMINAMQQIKLEKRNCFCTLKIRTNYHVAFYVWYDALK